MPLAKFQALQHRMVDMFIAYEQALSPPLRDGSPGKPRVRPLPSLLLLLLLSQGAPPDAVSSAKLNTAPGADT